MYTWMSGRGRSTVAEDGALVAEDGALPIRERGVAPEENSPGRKGAAAGVAKSEILNENYRITIVQIA
jgi:hypothetical protein